MSVATQARQSMTSSASRPLNLRMRADVSVQRQSYQGRDYWVVKDPLSLKYYRFEEEEFALLQLLDGSRSPEQIKRAFDYEYAPQKITLQELYQFVGMLYRSCLLVSDATGQGIELKNRSEKKSAQKIKGTLSNVLAVRFKGFDPDRILTTLDRWTWWLFTWPAFVAVLCLWISAAGLLFSQFEMFTSRLPGFHEFFAAKNWIWLALVMAVTKVIHEFGHGLACKRFGGQCHEMGVMLLVLTPCLYCNVSDSWTLPCKWKRAMIAAAGMYVELILAAMAVFVWWFSQPGMVNQLALNIVFVSSISTILFNGNPLLRYDGYYILSDLLEIPNLRQKATTILQRQLAWWVLGIESRPDPFLPTRRRWFFSLYSVAAVAYRWFITFSIFWFLYTLLEPYGVKVIGQAIALVAVWGLLGMPLIQAYRFFSVPGRFGTVNRSRVVLSACVAVAAIWAILLIPIPHHVRCPFIVQSAQAGTVYVDVPGALREVYVKHGQWVEPQQPLARLENFELAGQIENLKGKVLLADARVETLKRAAHSRRGDDSAAEELEVARAELESAQADLKQRQQDVGKLEVRARQAGFLVPPDEVPAAEPDTGSLAQWDGHPLDQRNTGAFLDQSTIVARIVPTQSQFEAVLCIDQNDIEFVSRGQAVKLFPAAEPGTTIDSRTQSISPAKMGSVPKALSSRHGGAVIVTQSDSGSEVPQSATFQVSVPFESASTALAHGCTGKARIRVGSQTVGSRIWRVAKMTFRFEL